MILFALAGEDVTRVQALLDSPVRHVLMIYLNHLKASAQASYDRSLMVWSNTAAFSKAKPPAIPNILEASY